MAERPGRANGMCSCSNQRSAPAQAPASQSSHPPDAPSVAVIIPNWNGRRFLAACFDSLRAQRYRDFEVVLVDNGSRDDSVSFTRTCYPEIRVIALAENHGFAAAVNRGIEAAAGRYVALLNNDTEADPDWLGELVQLLERSPMAASAASKMREQSAGRRSRLYGLGQALTPDGCPHRIGAGMVDEGQWDQPGEVFGACGGAALYRRAVLQEIGLLDEAFFAYLEDDDWAFRARLAGYRCLAAPAAVVYHVGSATSGAGSPLVFRLSTRNRVRLVLKNYPLAWLLRFAPALLASHVRLLGAGMLAGRLIPVLRGYGEALALLPDTLRERQRVQRLRRAPEAVLWQAISPPAAYVRPLGAAIWHRLFWRSTRSANSARTERRKREGSRKRLVRITAGLGERGSGLRRSRAKARKGRKHEMGQKLGKHRRRAPLLCFDFALSLLSRFRAKMPEPASSWGEPSAYAGQPKARDGFDAKARRERKDEIGRDGNRWK